MRLSGAACDDFRERGPFLLREHPIKQYRRASDGDGSVPAERQAADHGRLVIDAAAQIGHIVADARAEPGTVNPPVVLRTE